MAGAHALLVISLFGGSQAQPANGDWPQWGKNPMQQGFNLVGGAAPELQEWRFKPNDRVVSSPAVAHGRVHFTSDDGHLYCLNASSGQEVWKFSIPNPDPTCTGFECEHGLCKCPKARSSPAVDVDGNIYFGSYNHDVYKISPEGRLVWSITTGGAVYGPPTIDADGTIYIGSFDTFLYALSPCGEVRWRTSLGAHADAGIAVGEGAQSHILVTQANEGGNCTGWPPGPDAPASRGECYIQALDGASGRELWRRRTGQPGGGGTIFNGSYISGNWNGFVTSYDVATGRLNWRLDVGGEVESRPAVVGGVAFISTERSKLLLAISAATGREIWRYTGAAEELNGSPSVSGGLVLAGSNDRYLHAVDRFTGELRFRFRTCAHVFSSAAIDDRGMVYVGCSTVTGIPGPGTQPGIGEVYAINPSLHGPDAGGDAAATAAAAAAAVGDGHRMVLTV